MNEQEGQPVGWWLSSVFFSFAIVSCSAGRTSSARIRMGHWEYAYDAAGNLIHQTDARGQHLCFRYDPLNRLIAKGLGTPTSCSEFAWYGYDEAGHGQGAIGQRTSLYSFTRTQPNSDPIRTDWYYDSRGRVVSQTHTLWGNVYTLRFTYTPSDQVTTVTYPDGEMVTHSYANQRGLPTRLTSSLATYVDTARYTFYGQLERLTLGNGLQTTYTYDALFRLASSQTGANLQSLSYGYDDSNNVVWMVDAAALSPAETHSFSYDALNRLVTAASQGSAQTYAHSYTYDALGNLVSVIREGTPCDYRYGSRPHAVIEVSCGGVQTSYQYDANGNLTTRSQGGVTYQQQYDAENRLIAVTRTQGTSLQVTRFYYDADGNRVRQVTPDGTSTLYIGQWYEESQDGGRRVRTNYYYLGRQRVALRRGTVGQAGVVYWLHVDHLGSTSEVSGATGSLVGRERYYPYGQVRYSSGTLPTTYNYTGQRLDSSTGLLYYGARYYDPALMRFTQPDTLVPDPANPQSLNRYAYTLNNPLRYTDPTGHIPACGITGGDCNYLGSYSPSEIIYSPEGLKNTWNAVGTLAELTVSFAAPETNVIFAVYHWLKGDFNAGHALAALGPLLRGLGWAGEATGLTDDIAARLGPHSDLLAKVAHIPGADRLVGKLLSTSATTLKGAEFELEFAVQHADEIEEMGKVLEVIQGGNKEIDFVLKGNVFVNVKSYDWAAYNPYVLDVETRKMVEQATSFLKYNPSAIKYVFKGSVPDSVRQALEAAGIIVEVIP